MNPVKILEIQKKEKKKLEKSILKNFNHENKQIKNVNHDTKDILKQIAELKKKFNY